MGRVGKCHEVWMVESLRPAIRERHASGQLEFPKWKSTTTDLSGCDAHSWFVYEAFVEQVKGVGACGCEEIAERCFGELADGHVVG